MAPETALAPEARLLIALGKPRPGEVDRAHADTARSDPAFTWPTALRLAASHRVQPMLAWNLKSHDAGAFGCLPATVRHALGTALLAARARRHHYQSVVSPIFDRLNAQGIPFVLMKGAVVTETTYPPDARWLNDLDVLVPVAARSAAVDAFVRGGFRLTSALPAPDAYHQVTLTWDHDRGATLGVDLHWAVYPEYRPFTFDLPPVLSRARPMTFGSAHALGMSPEDTLVHYATQLFIDLFQVRLGRVCDIYSLLHGVSPGRLLEVASATGAAGITHTALRAASLLGAVVPADLLDSLARQCPGCAIGSELLADHRWWLGDQQASWGAMAVVTARYLPGRRQRRAYWRSLPRDVYRHNRQQHSSLRASLQVARGLFAVLTYGSLVRLLATMERREGRAAKLRDLLWRDA